MASKWLLLPWIFPAAEEISLACFSWPYCALHILPGWWLCLGLSWLCFSLPLVKSSCRHNVLPSKTLGTDRAWDWVDKQLPCIVQNLRHDGIRKAEVSPHLQTCCPWRSKYELPLASSFPRQVRGGKGSAWTECLLCGVNVSKWPVAMADKAFLYRKGRS